MSSSKSFFLLFSILATVFLVAPAVGQAPFDPADYDSCRMLVTSYDYRVYWRWDNTTVYFALSARNSGWLGLGISVDGSMTSSGAGSDVWVGWVGPNGNCTNGCIRDYWATQQARPTLDTAAGGTNNIVLVSGARVDDYMYLEFSRPRNTGDARDRVINPEVPIIFIRSLSTTQPMGFTAFVQHTAGTNGATTITLANFTDCEDPPPPNSGNSTFTNPDGTYRMSWRLFADAAGDKIEFTISAETSGWMGLGIGNQEDMYGDIIWVQVAAAGGPQVSDRFAFEREQPPEDPVQNLDAISASFENGWSTVVVQRLLDTGDNRDWVITDQNLILLWSYGSSKGVETTRKRDFDFDEHLSKGLARINFFTGEVTSIGNTDNLRKAHGAIMIFTWAIIAVAGWFIGRYYRGSQTKWLLFGYLWVHEHAIIGITVMIGTIIGFILIVVYVEIDGDEDHFDTAHHIIGLIMLILIFLHPLVGVVAAHMLRKGKEPGWIAWSVGQVHSWCGRALLLLGLVEIYLGLAVYCLPDWVFGVFGVMIFFMFLLFIPHEVLRWLAPWGSYLGGPGFRYTSTDDGTEMTERGKPLPEKVREYLNREPKQPHIAIKIVLWVFQACILVALIALWIGIVIGISDKDPDSAEDSFKDTCIVGEL